MLRERLFATLTSAEPEADEGFEVEGAALEPGAVRAWLDDHARDGRRVGLAVHGRLGTWAGRDVEGIALAAGEPSLEARAAGATAGPRRPRTSTCARSCPTTRRRWASGWPTRPCRRPRTTSRRRCTACAPAAGTLDGLTSDTALAAYLARPGQRSFDLADLALRYLRRELRAESEPENGQLSLLGGEEEADAARAQAQIVAASAVAELADALDAELARLGGTRLLAELELPLQGVLADLETAGVAVDREALAELEAEFAAQVKQAAQDAYGVIGKEINLGSPKQLQVVLFDELNMPKTKRTKTGYTTDADALQTLFEQTEHPFLSHLLVHRDATRLKVTVEGLLKSIADDGRIHTTYSQTIAATGRLSSTEPNLQNVPDPHGGGAADPRHVRRRPDSTARVRRADDGRLQPDRDADHGAPVGRRRADRGVPQPPRLPRRDRRARVRGRRRRGRARAPRQDQGDELRARVRAVGVRAVQPAADLHRGGPRADGRLLPDLRRRARLPRRRRRPGPQGRLHRDDPRPPPLPARPHHRQPPAPRDGRADGAQRPDPGQRGRHHQGRDAQRAPGAARGGAAQPDAAAGPRRAGARGRATASAPRSRSWCAGRWARRTRCRCRWRCRWATGEAGTRPRTRNSPARPHDGPVPNGAGSGTGSPPSLGYQALS